MALVRVYYGLALAEPTAQPGQPGNWLTVAAVDDSGRLMDVCEVPDDPAGYAALDAMFAERAGGSAGVFIAADHEDHRVVQLLGAVGRPIAIPDEELVLDYAERFADDESIEELNATPSQQRAVGLARALQAGALIAYAQAAPRELMNLKPVLAAHAAMAAGRNAAAAALRELLREVYPAALRAYPDPAAHIPMAVLEALPEPGLLSVGTANRGREQAVVSDLVAAGIGEQAHVQDAVTALRVAISETPRRTGLNRTLTAAIAESVGRAVASVRACDAAAAALVAALDEVTAEVTGGGRRAPAMRRAGTQGPAGPALRAVPEPPGGNGSLRPSTGPGRSPLSGPGRRDRVPAAGPATPLPPVASSVPMPPTVEPPVVTPRVASTQPPVMPTPLPNRLTRPAPAAAGPEPAPPGLSPLTDSRRITPPPGDSVPEGRRAQTQRAPGRPIHDQPFAASPLPSRPVSSQPVTGPPLPSRPVSSQPVTGPPLPPRPVSSQPVTGPPLPPRPVSSQPVSSTPISSTPVSGRPVSATPVSGRPGSGAPLIPDRGGYAGSHLSATGEYDQVREYPPALPRRGTPPSTPPPGSRSTWPLSAPEDDDQARYPATAARHEPAARPVPPPPAYDPLGMDTSGTGMDRIPYPRGEEPPSTRDGRVVPPWQSDDLPSEPSPLRLVEPAPIADRALRGTPDARPTPPPLRLVEPGERPQAPEPSVLTPRARTHRPPSAGSAPNPLEDPELSASGSDDADLLIFSQTRSAWFTGQFSEVDPANPIDLGWRAAEQAAEPKAGEPTVAGLPRRVPQANLVPGSALPTQDRPLRIVRDPAAMAAHTMGYFRGSRRGEEVRGYAVGGRPGRESATGWEFSRDEGDWDAREQRDNGFRSAAHR